MANPTETILMSKDNVDRWMFSTKLKRGSTLFKIKHGIKSCNLILKTAEPIHQTFIIDPTMLEALGIPATISKYQIKDIQTEEWVLGPYVGIFISEKRVQKLLSQKYTSVYDSYVRVLDRNQGLAVFMSLERIHWDKGEVIGVIRDCSKPVKVWREEVLPIPRVIYDRCFGSEGQIEGMRLRNKCTSLNQSITVINALPKLGKMEIYQLCSQDDTLCRHLPKWDIFRPENAENLLANFPAAYVKPNDLSKGKGVTKITHLSDGFLVEQRSETHNNSTLCSSVNEVLNTLADYLEAPMVIQEAIPLRKYKGNPFDFRLLLQKDDNGRWQQTGLAARIFRENCEISSSSGGSVKTYEEVMRDLPESQGQTIASSLFNLALKIAQAIEAQLGLFAELGFDLVVDLDGNVWFVEVNGKPLKVSIERLGIKSITIGAYERPLEYAIYLEGFACQTRRT